jgi:single-stranded DNA-binding protein
MDMTNVKALKCTVTSSPEAKVSGKGKAFTQFKLLHETEGGEKLWIDALAFGLVGKTLASKLEKGKKCLVSGKVKTEEKASTKDPNKVFVNRTLFVDELKVAIGDTLVTIDDFYVEPQPF